MILYVKTVTLENVASSAITNFQRNLFFIKCVSEDDDSQFYFLYYGPECLWLVTPISEIKPEKVFDKILRKMFLKYKSYISGPGDLTPSIM